MKVKDDCIGCGKCVPYCPMGAMELVQGKVDIVQDQCVECGNCLRAKVCPTDALYLPEIQWPRTFMRELSDPSIRHTTCGGSGRGTAEMKSNDVTGRFRQGELGLGIEVGRPGTGTLIRDVEKIAMLLCASGAPVHFEEDNPIVHIMADRKTGKFKEEILDFRLLSIIIEFKTDARYMPEIMKALEEAGKVIDTLFSVSMITRAEADESLPNVEQALKLGYQPSINAKVNVGLGRPKYEDREAV